MRPVPWHWSLLTRQRCGVHGTRSPRSPALDIVAPRSERARWPGWGAIAGLHERTPLHLSSAVTDPGRHGALRTRAEALPQEKKSLPIALEPTDQAAAACDGDHVRRRNLRGLLRGGHRYTDDQRPEALGSWRRRPRGAVEEPPHGLPAQRRGCRSDYRGRGQLGVRCSDGSRRPTGRIRRGYDLRSGGPSLPARACNRHWFQRRRVLLLERIHRTDFSHRWRIGQHATLYRTPLVSMAPVAPRQHAGCAGVLDYHDLELLLFVEVEQIYLAEGVEVVAGAWHNSLCGILDLDAGHEFPLTLAPFAFGGPPGGAVVAATSAIGAVPECRVTDHYSSHASNTIREAGLNYVVLLAVSAGIAIALQVTVNTIGLRDLGIGGLIGVSGLATAAVGFLATLFAQRPEYTGKALLCAPVSGVLGAFILGSIALAAGYGGVARTLSLVIASQLIAGLVVDRLGLLGAASQQIGVSKVLGIALILIGGVLVVRN